MRNVLIAAALGTALGALGAWFLVTEYVQKDIVHDVGGVKVRIEQGSELFLRDHFLIGITTAAAGGALIGAALARMLGKAGSSKKPRR